jgi:hypothetical protein
MMTDTQIIDKLIEILAWNGRKFVTRDNLIETIERISCFDENELLFLETFDKDKLVRFINNFDTNDFYR